MLYIALGRISQIVLMVITMKVATTLLLPAEMARVFLISSAVALYALVLLNPVGMFMNRRLHAWDAAGKIGHYYNYFWIYLLVVGVIAVALTALIASLNLLTFHTGLVWLLILIFSSIIISTANQVVIPGLNLLGHRTLFVYLTFATSAMSLVMAILMVMLIKPRAEYWLIGLLLGQLLIAFVGGNAFYKTIRPAVMNGHLKTAMTNNHIMTMWKFVWPILISACLVWGQTQSYRFIMADFLGLTDVGLFVAGYGISAGIIAGFESIFTTYLQPIFYKRISGDDKIEQGEAWTKYASGILPSLLLVGFFVVATAPELTRLLLGSGYKDSSKFLLWGVIAELSRAATYVYGMVAHARMKTKLLIMPNAIGAFIAITMILCAAPKYGAVGVGFSLAFAGLVVFIATYVSTRSQLITTLPYKTLLRCVIVGFVLLVVAHIARGVIGLDGITHDVMFLILLGGIYLPTQYWLLRPYFKSKK
ncbi:MAG: oligosaccharide flippase family protein [Methylophilaceae bacterium]